MGFDDTKLAFYNKTGKQTLEELQATYISKLQNQIINSNDSNGESQQLKIQIMNEEISYRPTPQPSEKLILNDNSNEISNKCKTIQEQALDFLRNLGKKTKLRYQNLLTNKVKQYCKSPQASNLASPSFQIRVHKLSYDPDSKNAKRSSNDLQQIRIPNPIMEIDQKFKSLNFLKLQTCPLEQDENEQKTSNSNYLTYDSKSLYSLDTDALSDNQQSFKAAYKTSKNINNCSIGRKESNQACESSQKLQISVKRKTKTGMALSQILKKRNAKLQQVGQPLAQLRESQNNYNQVTHQSSNRASVKSLTRKSNKQEEPLQVIKVHQQNFKAIRENLLTLVKELDLEQTAQQTYGYHSIYQTNTQCFKIQLMKTE